MATILALLVFMLLGIALTKAACPAKCTCDTVQKIVDCRDAGLTEIPWNLPDPSGMKQLILRGNKIKGIIAQIVTYHSLESLDLSDNEMSHIDSNTLNALPSLKYLHLQNNRLSSIETGTFAGLSALVALDLSNNLIETLDNGVFGDLSNLEDLNLASNSITNVQTNAFVGATSLKSLDLSNNGLKSIPVKALDHATNLLKLNLDSNKIESLPSKAFKSVSRLRELSIQSNELSVISDFSFHDNDTPYLPNLRKLSFRNNKLTQVPVQALSQFSSLEEFDLSQNLIEVVDADSFKNLKKLQVLYMNGMRSLKVVRNYALSEMRDLREIQMHSNPELKTIEPYTFVSSTHLIKVDLHGNALERLDSNLLNWNNLVYIDLRQNNWNCDCNAKWMRQILLGLKGISSAPLAAQVKCAKPGVIAMRPITSLLANEFICGDKTQSESTTNRPPFEDRIMIGLIAGMVGICFTVCIFLMCKYKYAACGINTEDAQEYQRRRRRYDVESANRRFQNGHICNGDAPHVNGDVPHMNGDVPHVNHNQVSPSNSGNRVNFCNEVDEHYIPAVHKHKDHHHVHHDEENEECRPLEQDSDEVLT